MLCKRYRMVVWKFQRIMTECSALAESKEGEELEPFNVRSEPKPVVYSSWGADRIGGHHGIRPDDRRGPRGGNCKYRPGEERRREMWGHPR